MKANSTDELARIHFLTLSTCAELTLKMEALVSTLQSSSPSLYSEYQQRLASLRAEEQPEDMTATIESLQEVLTRDRYKPE
jgi:hypothetical protein